MTPSNTVAGRLPLHKAHPWHGVSAGPDAPRLVNAYIEIVPTDTVKYEIDKDTGHLRVDRPQKYSNQCPAAYGFVPRTYCGTKVGKRCEERAGRTGIEGDKDPLDILVLTEKTLTHGDILVRAVPIGGLRMIDKNESDDKIIAVLHQDAMYGTWTDIFNCPTKVIDRLKHYFLTYKDLPEEEQRRVEIFEVFDAEEARKIISFAMDDYSDLERATGNSR